MLSILLGVDDSISCFFVFVSHLLGDALLSLCPHSFEHGCILEHRWNDDESDLRAPEIDLLDRHGSAILVEHSHVIQADVHGVLCVCKEASKHLACLHFDSDNVMLGLVEKFNRCAYHYFIRESIGGFTHYQSNIYNLMDFILAHSRYQRKRYE